MSGAHRRESERGRDNQTALGKESAKAKTMTIHERDVHIGPTADHEPEKGSTNANPRILQYGSQRLSKHRREE